MRIVTNKRLYSTLSSKARQLLSIKRPSEKQPATLSTFHHGFYRKDDYQVIRYDQNWQNSIVKREDAIFEQWKQKLMYHEDQWLKHVLKRQDPGDDGQVPEKFGEYFYSVKRKNYPYEKGEVVGNQDRSYDIYVRTKAETNEMEEQVILDLGEIPYIPSRLLRKSVVDKFKISDDHMMVAFTFDIGMSEKLTGGFKDMRSGKVLPLRLDSVGQIEFGCGNTVFYTETDNQNRPFKVVRLDIDTGDSKSVFVDDDPTHYIDIGVTKDKKFIVISSNTKEDSEVWIADRSNQSENAVPNKLISRVKDVQTHIDHLRDFFVTITTLGSAQKSFKIATLTDGETDWKDLLPFEDPNLVISEFDGFKDFFAIYCKRNGVPEIVIQDLDTKKFNSIKVNDEVGEISPGLNSDYNAQDLNFFFSSPFVYQQVYKYTHSSKSKYLVKEVKLQGAPQIVRNDFEAQQVLVPGHDGEQIPMNLYYKKGAIKMNRRNRVLMESYGAYGISLSQGFSIVNVCAMERGWVLAQAMVRGGGDLGIQWHDKGKIYNKHNSFCDLISCAEYLIANRITHPNLLAAKGSSAGGTLVAQTCLNLRPELFKACILEVPFLDILTCLLEESLPLTVTDHLEFGNPITDAKVYEQMLSYSPYDNLSQREFPAVYLSMQMNDPRVPYWSTLKFIEKLRDFSLDPTRMPHFGNRNIICKVNKDGGHFGSHDNETNLANLVNQFAWLDFLMLNPDSDVPTKESHK